MPTRSEIDQSLLTITPQQRDDLREIARFKKWTADLFGLAYHLNLSTAYRRLQRLLNARLLTLRLGRPLPGGGREPDIYALSPLGAAVSTRLLSRHSNYLTAPDLSNPIDNMHDLCTLEMAARSGCYDTAQAFTKIVSVETSVIPDVVLTAPDGSKRFFVEVEQTGKPAHIAGKYQRYARLFTALASVPGAPNSCLVIAFPSRAIMHSLLDDHIKAARQHAQPGQRLYYCTIDEMRRSGCTTYDDVFTTVDGYIHLVRNGFLNFLYPLLDD